MKHKVGDKVRIKSLEWFNSQEKNEYGHIELSGGWIFGIEKSKYCGRYATIIDKSNEYYDLDIDNNCFYWTDEMFEEETEIDVTITNVDSKVIDWEQRRYELVKAAMCGMLSSPDERCIHSGTKEICNWSLDFADEMIKQLKNK